MDDTDQIESTYAWLRLTIALLLMTIGVVGMYAVVVVLPWIEQDFNVQRAAASIPYSAVMIGFALGGIFMGHLADRWGITLPVIIGGCALGLGFYVASRAQTLSEFVLIHGLLIGLLGCSATTAPLLADVSMWFSRRRGLAVAICACGVYLGGALWPPIVQHFTAAYGWRSTYAGIAVFLIATYIPLSLLLRCPVPHETLTTDVTSPASPGRIDFAPNTVQGLLFLAGISCCVAMSMPHVHLVALCSDLGFSPARGAQMLAVMLACGVISRLSFGLIVDRIGGLATMLISSLLQAFALLCFLPAKQLVSLYLVSALFGLFQGGIVPCYAIIIREYFPAQEAGARIGIVFMATLLGMALGGWLAGGIHDWTGSYSAAFINGIAWNLLNVAIVLVLLWRRVPLAPAGARA